MTRIGIIVTVVVCLLIVLVGCVGEPLIPEPSPSESAPTATIPSTSPASDESPPTGLLKIISASPELGPLSGGTVVQILGDRIIRGAVVFFIQGDTAQEAINTTILSDTTISARTPPASRAGFADVLVALPDGQMDTLEDAFRYVIGSKEPAVTTPPTQAIPAPAPTPMPQPTLPPAPPVTTNVQITKIFYEGLISRMESDEYVEIMNLGNEPEDLTGWVLRDISEGYPSFTFPPFILAPGIRIRVYTNEIHDEWGGFSFGFGEAIWSNSSPETAGLYDAEGNEVSRRRY